MQNMKYIIPFFILLSSTALAGEVKGIYFYHEDWELACDNTRTCRAAGYEADEDASGEMPAPVSVLLTRRAGPHTPVTGKVKFGEDDSPTQAVILRIDGKPLGRVKYDQGKDVGTLSAAQVHALAAALRRTSHIAFVSGKRVYRLSGAGAAAVLLKMDDFQGRVGTPGALVRKGNKPESSVLPPVPAPELTIAKVDPLRPGDKALAKDKSGALHRSLRLALKTPDDCDQFDSKSELAVSRLSGGKLLVSADCWQAAYNSGSAYWIIDDHAPFHPLLVTTNGTGYQAGMITSTSVGRGMGDCMAFGDWYWNGSRFVYADSGGTGLCRGFSGGAWDMPTLINRSSTPWYR